MAELWVVMPVYNEAACIDAIVKEWIPVIREQTTSFTLCAINNGSTDTTIDQLETLRREFPELRIVNLEQIGHGQSCVEGYEMAVQEGAQWVLQIDSDGQCDPRFFSQMWQERDQAPVTYGFRSSRDDGWFRFLISRLVSVVVLLATGRWVRDPNVPYRLMSAKSLQGLRSTVPRGFHLANVLVSVIHQRQPGIRWFDIHFRNRLGGEANVKAWGFARRGLQLYSQLVRQNPKALSFILATACAVVFFAFRSIGWPFHSYIWPDESELLVQARMFLAGRRPWISIDSLTSGPLNYFVLLWPALIDAPPTYLTAQITSSVLKLAFLLLPFGLQTMTSRSAAWLSLLLLWSLHCFAHSVYSFHYFNSDLSNALLCLAFWFAVNGHRRFSAFILGSIPYAKIQFSLIAVVAMGILLLATFAKRRRMSDVMKTTAAALIVPAVMTGYLLLNHGFGDFWNSYIVSAAHYGSKRFSMSPEQLRLADAQNMTSSFFLNVLHNPDLRIYFISATLAALILSVRLIVSRRAQILIIPGVLLVAAAGSILISKNAATTYIALLFVPLTWLIAVGADDRIGRRILAGICGLAITLQAGLFLKKEFGAEAEPLRTQLIKYQTHYFPALIEDLQRLAHTGEPIAVWGYAPDLFLYTNTLPATRDAVGEFVVRTHPLTPYYRERYFTDFQTAKPKYFVDSTGTGAWNFNNRAEDGHEIFADFARVIATDYELVKDFGDDGPRLYVRKGF